MSRTFFALTFAVLSVLAGFAGSAQAQCHGGFGCGPRVGFGGYCEQDLRQVFLLLQKNPVLAQRHATLFAELNTRFGVAKAVAPAVAPVAGAPVPAAGIKVAGVAGVPVAAPGAKVVAGAPVGGAPVAGAPVGGAPVAGAPVAGAPVGGAPAASGPVAGGPVPGGPAGSPVAAPVIEGANPPAPAKPAVLDGAAPGGPAVPPAAGAPAGDGIVPPADAPASAIPPVGASVDAATPPAEAAAAIAAPASVPAELQPILGLWENISPDASGNERVTRLNLQNDGTATLTVDTGVGPVSIKRQFAVEDGLFTLSDGADKITLGKVISADAEKVVIEREGVQMTFDRPANQI